MGTLDVSIKAALVSPEVEALVRGAGETVKIPIFLNITNVGVGTESRSEKLLLEIPRHTLLSIIEDSRKKITTKLDIDIGSVHELMAVLAEQQIKSQE